MLMDFELHTMVNAKISELVLKAKEDFNTDIDMIVSQTSKYADTEYETIEYGLGCSKGLKSEKYYFNAILNENSEYNKLVNKCYHEPVTYYEQLGEIDKSSLVPSPILYKVLVQTFSRVITIYEVGFDSDNKPVYTKLETIDLKPSKFAKKIQHVEVA